MPPTAEPQNVLVTGATGFIGRKLVAALDNPIVTSRNPQRAEKTLGGHVGRVILWNPSMGPVDLRRHEPINAVVNLMGESVADGRWTEAKKRRIRISRVTGTRNLVYSLRRLDAPPKVMLSASAIGYYGWRGDEPLDENSKPGRDFLAQVAQQWEAEALKLEEKHVRVVLPRIGLVLGRDGGALQRMLPIFRWCLGGRLGSGQQWMSWIHVDDLIDLLFFSLEQDKIAGPLNAVSPNPVTNRTFTQALAGILGRPAMFPVPRFALRTVLGEFSASLLASQRAIPKLAQWAGFHFQHATLEAALKDLLAAAENR